MVRQAHGAGIGAGLDSPDVGVSSPDAAWERRSAGDVPLAGVMERMGRGRRGVVMTEKFCAAGRF